MLRFLIFLLPVLLTAQILNGVSVIVNNEPITLYEVYKKSKESDVAYDEAIELLIDTKLKNIEARAENIVVDDIELNEELEKIATKNRLSLYQFQSFLKERGIDLRDYKNRLRDKLTIDKLNKKIAYKKLRDIDEVELKEYYDKHKNEFTLSKEFDVIKYEAKSKKELESVILNPMLNSNSITKEKTILNANYINPRLSIVLNETKERSFSPILSTENTFISFYLIEKLNKETLAFDEVKDGIFNKLVADKEDKVIKEYFEKAKAKAKIEIVRLPN